MNSMWNKGTTYHDARRSSSCAAGSFLVVLVPPAVLYNTVSPAVLYNIVAAGNDARRSSSCRRHKNYYRRRQFSFVKSLLVGHLVSCVISSSSHVSRTLTSRLCNATWISVISGIWIIGMKIFKYLISPGHPTVLKQLLKFARTPIHKCLLSDSE